MNIIHISDLHFGLHDELIMKIFIEDMNRLKPDAILISGDLTQRAHKAQFKRLQTFIKSLPQPVLAVPGNHDIPLWDPLARALYPFYNYKKYVSPLADRQLQTESLIIMGVNSVNPHRIKKGRLSASTLKEIDLFFQPEDARLKILFFHHNFDYLEGLHKPLEDYEAFISHIKESPINIVCTGHLHYAHTSILSKNDNRPCLLLHAGSLFCQRSQDKHNSYYLISTDGRQCRVSWQVFIKDAFIGRTQYEIDLSKPHAHLNSTTHQQPI